MKRRVFIQFSDDQHKYQILNISQSILGGDIYCTVPKGKLVQYHGFSRDQKGQIILLKTKTKPDEKTHLSVHASGELHIKNQATREYSPALKGNKLANLEGKELSARHIFTLFPSKPLHIPFSPVDKTKDVEIHDSGATRPAAFVCFAVPRGIQGVNLQFTFHVDDIESVPPDGGVITFELVHHLIIALAYRAKNLPDWPDDNIILYGDGYIAPFVMGYKERLIAVELREPSYHLNEEQTLTITLPTKHLDDGLETKMP